MQDKIERSQSSGFTLIELLVVVAIIAVLAGILFPVFAQARQKAWQITCICNLRQITMAWMMYAQDYDDVACPAYYYTDNFNIENAWDFTVDWAYYPVYGACRVYAGFLSPYVTNVRLNQCPMFKASGAAASGRPFTGYAYNTSYVGGDPWQTEAGYPTKPASLSEIQHPAQTVLFADSACYLGGIFWGNNYLRSPNDPDGYGAGQVNYRHTRCANVAYADGHVAAVSVGFHFVPGTHDLLGFLSSDDSAYMLN
jgi:prepilin-type N-terminal cleavage/methylation domain-containing protein/prepilin-type processing-associated H-X9-DG protein